MDLEVPESEPEDAEHGEDGKTKRAGPGGGGSVARWAVWSKPFLGISFWGLQVNSPVGYGIGVTGLGLPT